MPEAKSSQHGADRNLLFGILAFQLDFINQSTLVAALQSWVFRKATPLGQILMEQGAIGTDCQVLLEALVHEHLRQHGNDTQQSLAAVSSVDSLRAKLEQIGEPDLQASLAGLPSLANDPYATAPPVPCSTADQGANKAPSPTSEPARALRFRILRPHAKGGLGEVFVAEDQELHREVALKEIQACHADHPESRSRFLLEAEITGRLEHPGIVPVYGLGTYADGRPYRLRPLSRALTAQIGFGEPRAIVLAGQKAIETLDDQIAELATQKHDWRVAIGYLRAYVRPPMKA
jgi:hypothetical protein